VSDPLSDAPADAIGNSEETLDGGIADWGDDGDVDGGRAKAVLAFLAGRLVDDPSAVRVETSENRSGIKLALHVAPDDMGKVIGRRGRVAQSIRSVVRAAGARDGVDVFVDIVD